MKKYTLTDETKEINGTVLRRIKATKTFSDVIEGTLGGWIENELNLSHEGGCWVYDDAQVYGLAQVKDNAKITKQASVYDNAIIDKDAQIISLSSVYGTSHVSDSALIGGWAHVCGRSYVRQRARVNTSAFVESSDISGAAQVWGGQVKDSTVFGNASIGENAQVLQRSTIYGNATVQGRAMVRNANIMGHLQENAKVSGAVTIHPNALLRGDSVVEGSELDIYYGTLGEQTHIQDQQDYLFIGKDPQALNLVIIRQKDGTTRVQCNGYGQPPFSPANSNFYGSLSEFKNWALERTQGTPVHEKYIKLMEYISQNFPE